MYERLFSARSWLVAIALALTLLVLPGIAFAQVSAPIRPTNAARSQLLLRSQAGRKEAVCNVMKKMTC